MDLANDHIPAKAYDEGEEQKASLNADLQNAYKAFSASPWGARIGGFLGTVAKQGETVYAQAQKEFAQGQKEFAEVGEDALKGITKLRETVINRTRSLSLNTAIAGPSKDGEDNQKTPTETKDLSKDQEANVLSRLRFEAAKRLKDLHRAEEAADEALLKFGSNIRDFLKEAISIAPPGDSEQGSTVLFESKDASGKRAFHASRFDAQLHVIHTSPERLNANPSGEEYTEWTKDFDVEKKTEEISADLAKYPELRTTMEKTVPGTITYADFWKRYYYLRHGIETAENRRKELLKAAQTEDEVAWDDDDSEDDGGEENEQKQKNEISNPRASIASVDTIQAPEKDTHKEARSRKSDERSQADSEASYDVVGAASGKTSRAPNSPKVPKKEDDSDEDWE